MPGPEGRGAEVKQEGHGKGQESLPFIGRTEQEKREKVLGHRNPVGRNGEDLVLEPDGPHFNPTSSFTSCVTPSQHLTSLGLSVKPTLQGSDKALQSPFHSIGTLLKFYLCHVLCLVWDSAGSMEHRVLFSSGKQTPVYKWHK